MRQVAKRGILTAVATGSVLASTAGYAYAGTEAQGGAANSAGVGSGNAVQAPVDIPVNACGNTVNVVGLLNPAMGNSCGSSTRSLPAQGSPGHSHPGHPGAGHMGAGHMGSGQAGPGNSDQWHPGEGHLHPGTTTLGSSASGVAHGSPGVASGNQVQAPVTVPVNACGNTVDVVGLGNPAFGNDCANQAAAPAPVSTPAPTPPPPAPGDDCTPGGSGSHNPPPTVTPPVVTPPVSTPPAVTPPVDTPPASVPPGTGRAGGPTEVTPVSAPGLGTESGRPAGSVVIPAQAAQSFTTPTAAPSIASPARGQLASTGASGVELLGSAGAALMLAGGVLYRRSRAGVR